VTALAAIRSLVVGGEGMSVTTRIASDADLPFLREVDRHVSHKVQTELVSLGRVMVAEVGGVAVGCLRWGMFWDEVPFMNLLWVVPERRGSGVGTTMIEAWEKAQLAAGQATVLTSTVSAERAQHLYRRLGYVDTGARFLPDEPTEIILRKSLAK
jgi:predicted GNAT family acetyltransferase